jgi:6-phosphogluconolactonase
MAEWDNLKILADKPSLVRYSAERIVRMVNATLEHNDTFSIALSGGSTPEPIYDMLGTMFGRLIDWSSVHIWWGDERCVPPDDEQSNYFMTKATLLDHIKIPAENVHRIRGEDEPEQAAKSYETELREFFKNDEALFDLNLLGIGEDGHTASLSRILSQFTSKKNGLSLIISRQKAIYGVSA